MEWSSRRIQRRAAAEDQVMRWYSALAPNRPATVAA